MAAGPLRFCLALNHAGWARAKDPAAAAAETLRLGRLADEAGLDSVWASEDPDGWDAYDVLGAIARETEHIRLGTGVTNPYLRHPNLIAASVATLDRLSNGRAFLGMGRGQPEWYERSLGIPVGKPLQVLEEAFGLLRDWWRPPHRASTRRIADGALYFRVHEWERAFGPVQPAPPIYLAAVGPKALALAGRLADGLILNDLASPTFTRKAIEQVRESARAAGRNPDSLAVFLRGGLTVTDEPERVLEQRKTTIAMIHALPGMERLLETPGFDTEAIIAEVRRLMRTDEVLARGGGFADLRRAGDLDAARKAIPTELIAQLALVGPVPELRRRLADLRYAGVTHVFVAPPPAGISATDWAVQLHSLIADS